MEAVYTPKPKKKRVLVLWYPLAGADAYRGQRIINLVNVLNKSGKIGAASQIIMSPTERPAVNATEYDVIVLVIDKVLDLTSADYDATHAAFSTAMKDFRSTLEPARAITVGYSPGKSDFVKLCDNQIISTITRALDSKTYPPKMVQLIEDMIDKIRPSSGAGSTDREVIITIRRDDPVVTTSASSGTGGSASASSAGSGSTHASSVPKQQKILCLSLFDLQNGSPLDRNLYDKLMLVGAPYKDKFEYKQSAEVDIIATVEDNIRQGLYSWIYLPIPSRFLKKDDPEMAKVRNLSTRLAKLAKEYHENKKDTYMCGMIYIVTDFPIYYPMDASDGKDEKEKRHRFQELCGESMEDTQDPWVSALDLDLLRLAVLPNIHRLAYRYKRWLVHVDEAIVIPSYLAVRMSCIAPVAMVNKIDPLNVARTDYRHIVVSSKWQEIPKAAHVVVLLSEEEDAKVDLSLFPNVVKVSKMDKALGMFTPEQIEYYDMERLCTVVAGIMRKESVPGGGDESDAINTK